MSDDRVQSQLHSLPLKILLNKLTELHSTLKLLRKAYQRTGIAEAGTIETIAAMTSLRLAEAFLEKNLAVSQLTRRIPQIAVLGPTQAGKSTVVNLLLGARYAQTSPLAGYTVHPQAFGLTPNAAFLETLDSYFHDFKRCAIRDLAPGFNSAGYAQFGWEQIGTAPDHPLAGSVIWDTPDFDTVDAGRYRHGLIRTIAFADIVVIVLSKDKYADQSVWELIELLAPLEQPTLLCLNKVDADAEATLTGALQEKWSRHRRDGYSALIALPYRKPSTGEEPQLASIELLQAAQTLAERRPPSGDAAAERALALIAEHWRAWIAPIEGERLALNRWQALIEARVTETLQIYQRDYLDHPRHYNSFQRALAELLTLLEIPGFARGIALTRQVLTWPFRQLTQLAHKQTAPADDEREIVLLGQTFDHLLIRLSEAALDAAEDDGALRGWWRELAQKLRAERSGASARFLNAAEAYHLAFKPEIEHTAQQLHAQLSRHPAILNSLRATRAFADTTALALALHTGGIGVQDFVIAPATITITSLLTESALGRYLGKAQAELKARQLHKVKTLFQTQAEHSLSTLPSRLDPQRRFNIPLERLASVERLLNIHER